MSDVLVVIGPGQIGQAIARRVGVGKHVLLADSPYDARSGFLHPLRFAWKAATPGRSRLAPTRRIVGLIAHNLARVAERDT
jgi:hypothetical protein